MGALAGHVSEPPAQVAGGPVERGRHLAELVGAVIGGGAREVVRLVAAGGVGHGADAPAQDGRRHPREDERREKTRTKSDRGNRPDDGQPGFGRRERECGAYHGDRHAVRGHRGVDRLGARRAAAAHVDTPAGEPGREHLRTLSVVLDRRKQTRLDRRIGDHGPVGRDERHPHLKKVSERQGFVLEGGRALRAEELVGHAGPLNEIRLHVGPERRAHPERVEKDRDTHRNGARREDADEDARAKSHGWAGASSSR